MVDNLRVHIQKSLEQWNSGFDVIFWIKTDSYIAVAEPILMKATPLDSTQAVSPSMPTLRISPTTAQAFMDELWNVGIRPTEGSGSAGALAATQRHLDDMRALVFKRKPA